MKSIVLCSVNALLVIVDLLPTVFSMLITSDEEERRNAEIKLIRRRKRKAGRQTGSGSNFGREREEGVGAIFHHRREENQVTAEKLSFKLLT